MVAIAGAQASAQKLLFIYLFGVDLYKMVSEFLIGILSEHGLFPEVGGEIAVGLGDGFKGGLG